jgi:hypothetical protein
MQRPTKRREMAIVKTTGNMLSSLGNVSAFFLTVRAGDEYVGGDVDLLVMHCVALLT